MGPDTGVELMDQGCWGAQEIEMSGNNERFSSHGAAARYCGEKRKEIILFCSLPF
jgi:hypothetical protein